MFSQSGDAIGGGCCQPVSWSVSTGNFPGLQNVFLASAKANGSSHWTRATGKSQAGSLPSMQSSLDRGMSGSCERERTLLCQSRRGSAPGWMGTCDSPGPRSPPAGLGLSQALPADPHGELPGRVAEPALCEDGPLALRKAHLFLTEQFKWKQSGQHGINSLS